MRRLLPVAILGVLIGKAPACAAETFKTEPQTRKIVHDYARCVVRKRADRASEAIIANADNSIIQTRYSLLIDSSCMYDAGGDVSVHFGADLYRYALADALVNARFANDGPVSFADRLPLAHLPFPDGVAHDAELAKIKSKRRRGEIEEGFKKAQGVAWLSRYGECVVRQQPVKARLWLLTPPDGPEETSRINDLRPAFAGCLVNSAGTVRFNRTTMRGTVAINYYRLAMATPIPGKQH